MELRHLKSFITVAEELHFGRASIKLHIAGPALSKQIQQLEKDLGFPLFERTTRSVKLTAGGMTFLERIRAVLSDVERAQQAGSRADRGETGHLSVGFSGSATYDVLPKVARTFRERYPYVELELGGEMISGRQILAIANGTLDVGFVRAAEIPAPLLGERVATEPLMALVPKAHPLASEEIVHVNQLATEPFISYDSRSSIGQAVEATCEKAGFTPSISHLAAESYAVACLVAAGFGVALVPRGARHLQMPDIVYIPMPEAETEPVHLFMVWHPDNAAPAVRNFLKTSRDVLLAPGTFA